MVLFVLRGVFIVLVAAVATLYISSEFQEEAGLGFAQITALIALFIGSAAAVVALDAGTKHKKLSAVSGIFLGLVAGLTAAYALSFVVDLMGVYLAPEDAAKKLAFLDLLQGVKVAIGMITCYLGISLVLQTKDDFRFVIPYVEFAKQIRGHRPTILDTSIIIDGRILDVIETRVMQGVLIVPKFVLDELQALADSADKLKRARGRRGLDVLKKLQETTIVEIHLEDHDTTHGPVDERLIQLGQQMRGRVMTNDFNLNKVAELRGVEVISMNDLAKAMKPVVLPGEALLVKLVKAGESPTQGVGYLDDGTMVVVEDGRSHLGQQVDLTVTSTLQTSAGRMIFGRFSTEHSEPGVEPDEPGSQSPSSAPQSPMPGAPAPSEPQALGSTSGNDQPPSRSRRPASARRNPRRS